MTFHFHQFTGRIAFCNSDLDLHYVLLILCAQASSLDNGREISNWETEGEVDSCEHDGEEDIPSRHTSHE
jgi:hypothetical protein